MSVEGRAGERVRFDKVAVDGGGGGGGRDGVKLQIIHIHSLFFFPPRTEIEKIGCRERKIQCYALQSIH